MAFERKDLQGAAFKNDKKIEDWHADFRGDILVKLIVLLVMMILVCSYE